MSAVPGRSARRKTVRVGTVFTGAVACATAFGPTAAAAAAPAVATGNRVALTAITEKDCPNPQGNDEHWFHLYWQAASKHGPTCIGYKGTVVVDHIFQAWCPGDNFGWIKWISVGGTSYKSPFSGEGFLVSYINPFFAKSVHISRWSGSGACGF